MAASLALAWALDEFFDVGPDAFRNGAAPACCGMRDVPLDALLPRRLRRHAMGPVPFLVQNHADALFRLIVERRSLVDDVNRQILHCLVSNDLECAVRRVAAVYASRT